MRTYNFQTELEALRVLFGREAMLDVKYIPASHPTLIPMLSIFGQALKGMKSKDTRVMRLRILSLWLEKTIRSSYELTAYQVSTIIVFLEYAEGQELTERTKNFLSDSQAAVEARDLYQPFGQLSIENSSPFMPKL